MSSYAASALISRARPHLRSPDAAAIREVETAVERVSLSSSNAHDRRDPAEPATELVDPLDEDGVAMLFERLATVWSQTTWFLFNPEGWR